MTEAVYQFEVTPCNQQGVRWTPKAVTNLVTSRLRRNQQGASTSACRKADWQNLGGELGESGEPFDPRRRADPCSKLCSRPSNALIAKDRSATAGYADRLSRLSSGPPAPFRKDRFKPCRSSRRQESAKTFPRLMLGSILLIKNRGRVGWPRGGSACRRGLP